jgi:hypothetical protein
MKRSKHEGERKRRSSRQNTVSRKGRKQKQWKASVIDSDADNDDRGRGGGNDDDDCGVENQTQRKDRQTEITNQVSIHSNHMQNVAVVISVIDNLKIRRRKNEEKAPCKRARNTHFIHTHIHININTNIYTPHDRDINVCVYINEVCLDVCNVPCPPTHPLHLLRLQQTHCHSIACHTQNLSQW